MHTRVLFLFFISLSLSLSLCSLFPLLFRDRRPLHPSQALSPFLSFAHSVLRNTHATSTLKRARALHPLHRDALSKIQPFFSPADQWTLPLPLYPPVPTSPFFVIRHSTGSKFHSFPFTRSLANNLFGATSGTLRADVLSNERIRFSPLRSAASLGFLAVALILLLV